MRYWWVNQNQTYRAEVRGSFMWSPKQNANGARNQFYENMREVSPGDIVFSFCDTRIKAIGVVTGGAQTGPKPDFGAAGANWSREGWFVPVDYCVLTNQIRPKDHAAILRPFLPSKYSPLQESGDGLQSVYLAEVPQALADAMIGRSNECTYPAEVLDRPVVTAARIDPRELESVEIDRQVRAAIADGRSLYAVDAALIDRLAPDVIVTQDLCAVCAVSSGELAERARSARP